MIKKYRFEIDKQLRMDASDFADWSTKHYRLTFQGFRVWRIECWSLKHMAEALVVLNYGDERDALLDMKSVKITEVNHVGQ